MNLFLSIFHNLWLFLKNHFRTQNQITNQTSTSIIEPCEIDIDTLLSNIPHLSENSLHFIKQWASRQQSDDVYALIDCFRDYAQNVQEAYLTNDCFTKVEHTNTGFENRNVSADRYELHNRVLALANSHGLSYEEALDRI